MVFAVPADRPRSVAAGLLDRWRGEAVGAGELLECGVRVVAGRLPGEGPRWRYRRSAVDPHAGDRVVALLHGDIRLRLRFDAPVEGDVRRRRLGWVVWTARELGSDATVEIAVAAADAARLGLPADPG